MSTALPALLAAAAAVTSAPGAEIAKPPCFDAGAGFFRARIRGALNLDLDWRNADLACEGSARPDDTGLRLSFSGPLERNGRRLRLIFGISRAREGVRARALPVNLTVIIEGEQRVFATRGDDKCTVDDLRQERVPGSGSERTYRVIARGFCVWPANAIGGSGRIVLSSFDFAGRATYESEKKSRAAEPAP